MHGVVERRTERAVGSELRTEAVETETKAADIAALQSKTGGVARKGHLFDEQPRGTIELDGSIERCAIVVRNGAEAVVTPTGEALTVLDAGVMTTDVQLDRRGETGRLVAGRTAGSVGQAG
jgi:hypothetical protein